MMISSKGRYALRVMLELAEHRDEGYIRLSDIARRQEISRKYLESIMAELCRAGLVDSALGKTGGYRLTRQPGEYRVGEYPHRGGGGVGARLLPGHGRRPVRPHGHVLHPSVLEGLGEPHHRICQQLYPSGSSGSEA